MRRLALFFALLLVPVVAAGQQVHTYTLLGAEKTDHGQLVDVKRGADTLTVYTEHVTRWERPHYQDASSADIVFWCYPDKYDHPSHLFPEAKGRVYSVVDGNVITFFSNAGAEQIGVDPNKQMRASPSL